MTLLEPQPRGSPCPLPSIAEAVPGQAAGIAHPALLLLVVAAAVLADVEVTVQALPLAVQKELEGLETVDAVGFVEVGLICQELSLAALLVDLPFQLPAENIPKHKNLFLSAFHCELSHVIPHHASIISGMIFQGTS